VIVNIMRQHLPKLCYWKPFVMLIGHLLLMVGILLQEQPSFWVPI